MIKNGVKYCKSVI